MRRHFSAVSLGPMQRFVFKFIRISMDGGIIENDTKTIVCMDGKHFYPFSRRKHRFQIYPDLVWAEPKTAV